MERDPSRCKFKKDHENVRLQEPTEIAPLHPPFSPGKALKIMEQQGLAHWRFSPGPFSMTEYPPWARIEPPEGHRFKPKGQTRDSNPHQVSSQEKIDYFDAKIMKLIKV